ncbi:MAG: DUF4623 domain-containing protein [Armatimonadetes bacterium]|nr:DUF4623 domain-containing protein [Armatimonadota bacterium]
MSAKTSWGFNGDGWWAPSENGITYLTTTNEQRSMSYNPVTKRVYVTNGLSIRALNGSTGASEVILDTTGVTGGARALNTVGVASDGTVYAANLTTNTTTSPYKIYKWASEGSSPTNVYSGNAGLAGARLGDDLNTIGGGSSFLLAAGFSNSPAVAGNNGYVAFDGTTLNAVGFTSPAPSAGDFRLGIAPLDTSSVIGTQSGSAALRVTTFAGPVGTLVSTLKLSSASERGLEVTTVNGYRLLATIDSVSSLVRVYNLTTIPADGSTLAPIASGNLTVGTLAANGNGTCALAWGETTGNTISLYAMSSNQGIQAFNVEVVPEPATMAALGLGLAAVIRRRKKA